MIVCTPQAIGANDQHAHQCCNRKQIRYSWQHVVSLPSVRNIVTWRLVISLSGSPSVCWQDEDNKGKHCGYRFTHEKDGCGFYVPQNYSDQWASTVTLIGRHLTCSPSHLLLGPPPSNLKCKSSLSELAASIWQPCQMGQLSGYVREDYALKVSASVR